MPLRLTTLASFNRARALGFGGARDIGLPAARAAVRANDRAQANRWIAWALRSFPRIRSEIEADGELAPLLASQPPPPPAPR